MGISSVKIVRGDKIEEDVLKHGFVIEGVLGIWRGATISKLIFNGMGDGIGGGSAC